MEQAGRCLAGCGGTSRVKIVRSFLVRPVSRCESFRGAVPSEGGGVQPPRHEGAASPISGNPSSLSSWKGVCVMEQMETSQATQSNTRNRGFASMNAERQKEIARKGGKAAHEKGTAHEFTPDEARAAGRKGGERVSADRHHMSRIGRMGGKSSAGRRQTMRQTDAFPGATSNNGEPGRKDVPEMEESENAA